MKRMAGSMKITKIPGTTIDAHIENNSAEKILTPMFYSGGLVLSQVVQITGLEGYIIQNWIKRKYLPPPENKKYSRNQLCRILNINILKDCFTLDQTEAILNYINVTLKSEDGPFDDSDLYSYFVNTLALLQARGGHLDVIINNIISGHKGKYAVTRQRLGVILQIMVTAYESLEIKNKAVELFKQLDFR